MDWSERVKEIEADCEKLLYERNNLVFVQHYERVRRHIRDLVALARRYEEALGHLEKYGIMADIPFEWYAYLQHADQNVRSVAKGALHGEASK